MTELMLNSLDRMSYDVTETVEVQTALEFLAMKQYDLIILDTTLTEINISQFCTTIRKEYKNVLILMLLKSETTIHKERMYAFGADDYLSKPFSSKLFILKLTSLLERSSKLSGKNSVYVAKLRHDMDKKYFLYDGNVIDLTRSEYTILEILFKTPSKIFSSDELSQILYNEDIGNIDKGGIPVHIYKIRKKIALWTTRTIVKTIRSVGYTLDE